jgi:hypothetical protein
VEKLFVEDTILFREAEEAVEVFPESFDIGKRMEAGSTRDTFLHFAQGDTSTSQGAGGLTCCVAGGGSLTCRVLS